MARPLRIAFDARSLASPVLRGWDRYTVGLVGELVRQGVSVALFHRAYQALHTQHVGNLGCHVVGLADRGGLHWEQVAVPLALWRGKFDLFHAPAEHGVPLAAPCPVVLTYHSTTLHSYSDLVNRGLLPGPIRDYLGYDGRPDGWNVAALYQRAQLARANHILTPSEFCRNEVIKFLGLSPDRVTTTPLAVHEQFLRPPSSQDLRAATLARLGVRKPYLLYVGGYEPHKNINGLLATFALVHAVRPELSLVVVGSKSAPGDMLQHAKSLGLVIGRDVVFLVNLTDELTALYDDAELFASLSWRETFCLPALEAMTRGIQVVVSAWGGAREVLGETGRLVDPRDHAGARDVILELLLPADMADKRKEARVRAQRFSWEQTAGQTLAVYNLLKGREICPPATITTLTRF